MIPDPALGRGSSESSNEGKDQGSPFGLLPTFFWLPTARMNVLEKYSPTEGMKF